MKLEVGGDSDHAEPCRDYGQMRSYDQNYFQRCVFPYGD
jgi:hypothetical protein